jgi:hypothetical protein
MVHDKGAGLELQRSMSSCCAKSKVKSGARRLSDLGLIYCGKVGSGKIVRSFSLNSDSYSPQTIENLPQTDFSSLRSPKSDSLLAQENLSSAHISLAPIVTSVVVLDNIGPTNLPRRTQPETTMP